MLTAVGLNFFDLTFTNQNQNKLKLKSKKKKKKKSFDLYFCYQFTRFAGRKLTPFHTPCVEPATTLVFKCSTRKKRTEHVNSITATFFPPQSKNINKNTNTNEELKFITCIQQLAALEGTRRPFPQQIIFYPVPLP